MISSDDFPSDHNSKIFWISNVSYVHSIKCGSSGQTITLQQRHNLAEIWGNDFLQMIFSQIMLYNKQIFPSAYGINKYELYVSYFDLLQILDSVYLKINKFEFKCGTSTITFLAC